ncbi:MAG: flagellar basal body L-ring protein FlgH [Opitutae bacterium]|nr:flagellar basal body L-ring protein FlgH [Opitutae bacterium]
MKRQSLLRHWPALAAGLAAALPAPAGSLWADGASDRGMFADRKAARAGDILTIVVNESVSASNSQSKKSTRDSTIADAVSSFLYPTTGLHKGALPSVSIKGSASNAGGGDISNSQSLSAQAAVLVTDVLPNGNMVIEGMRVVTFSGETQYVVLHGLVRPDDVSRANTVASSNIADARVEFLSEGSLTDAQKRGWLFKLYEKLRPF